MGISIGKKILLIILVLLLGGFLVWAGILWGYPVYQKWQMEKQTKKFLEEYTKPYKEDTYGGKTPEETWDMFLGALKKGDVELAAKYFEVKKQDEILNWLKDIRARDQVEAMVNDLTISPLHEVIYSEERAEYTVSGEDKEARAYIIFNKNNLTNIWKISSL